MPRGASWGHAESLVLNSSPENAKGSVQDTGGRRVTGMEAQQGAQKPTPIPLTRKSACGEKQCIKDMQRQAERRDNNAGSLRLDSHNPLGQGVQPWPL